MTDRETVLNELAREWKIGRLALVGKGLEFTVYRATGPDGTPVALRLAEHRFDSNVNDPGVDTRALLVQEYEICRHLSRLGFPVAEPLELRLGENGTVPDVLLSRYIPDDGGRLDGQLLGALLARLHQLPAPRLTLVAAEGTTTSEVVAARIRRRWAEVGRLVTGWPEPPAATRLSAALSRIGTSGLVHLDVRRDNVRRAQGQVEALLDWSNALYGDATVEFGRLIEYARYSENELDLPAIRAGYAQAGLLPPDTSSALLVCRLDAALMLALVFLSEAPDSRRGPAAADHARALAEQLAGLRDCGG